MVLTDGSGRTYAVHFTHARVVGEFLHPERFDDHTRIIHRSTTCTIHEGKCANKARPCRTPGMVSGTARCSVKDHFCRFTGRKMAFGRAIAGFPKQVRAALWRDWLRQSGVLGECPQGEGERMMFCAECKTQVPYARMKAHECEKGDPHDLHLQDMASAEGMPEGAR